MNAAISRLRCRCGAPCAVVAYALTMLCVAWAFLHGAEGMGYNWQWYRVPKFILLPDGSPGPRLQGAGVTLLVSGLGLVGAAALALTTALLRLSASRVGRAMARVYLELIRNTPLLVQIFFIYFVLAPALGIGRLASAVLALSLFEGAYASEIIRSGILAIPRGQWEGALSLGMTRAGVYRQVILPQALRNVLPPLTSQGVSLIKDSALVSTIAIYDLTMHGQAIVAETFLSFEIWFVVAAVYLLFTGLLSSLARILEKQSPTPHLEDTCSE
jgi:polar amino acid transport system permease protein